METLSLDPPALKKHFDGGVAAYVGMEPADRLGFGVERVPEGSLVSLKLTVAPRPPSVRPSWRATKTKPSSLSRQRWPLS